MNRTIVKKFFSLLTSAALLVQSFAPMLPVVLRPVPVLAQETTATPTQEPTPIAEPTTDISPIVSSQEQTNDVQIQAKPTPTPTPTPASSPTPTPTPVPACSAGSYTLEGQTVNGNYTSGNLCSGQGGCWALGSNVPARLTITGLTIGQTYTVTVQHDYLKGGTIGYDNFNTPTSGNNTADTISFGAPTTVSCGGGVTCKNYTLTFTALDSTVQLDWFAQLGPQANQWNGASLHFTLIGGVCDENVGNKDVPLGPPDQIIVPTPTPTATPTPTPTPTPMPATITVNKTVSPATDSGLFNLQIDGSTAGTGANVGDGGTTGSITVDTSTQHAVSETAGTATTLSSYNSSYSCTNGVTGSGTTSASFAISAGENVVCTFTNTRKVGTLRVIKQVVNDNGGTLQPSDFTLHVQQNTTEVAGSPQPGSDTGTVYPLPTGTYTVSETPPPTGYTQTGFSGDCDSNGDVLVAEGVERTCTIINDDIAPTLTVTKVVVNDNGGIKQVSDFSLFVNGVPTTSGATQILDAGDYVVSETPDSGYIGVISGDCDANGNVALALGETKSCTITNDDIPASLTVIKSVVNDKGGTLTAPDFTMNVTGANVSDPSFPGSETGTTVTLDAGSYSVSENGVTSYASSLSADCTGTIANGETKTCTITNNDVQPLLTVTKIVVNDNGGTRIVTDFPLYVDATQVVSGEQNGFNVGSYVVSEVVDPGYEGTIVGDCDAQGNVTLALGDIKSCTITNDDRPATLTLIKTVINDNGGDKVVSDFVLSIDSTTVTSGVANSIFAGVHQASEVSLPGYSASDWGGDCAADGTVTLFPGENKTCTIVNDDVAPTVTLTKVVSNTNGGTTVSDDFGLTVGGSSVLSGATTPVLANTPIALNEASVSGYTFTSLTGDAACPSGLGGTVTLLPGENVSCTITNSDTPAQLTIIKTVINDNGGTASASAFTLDVIAVDSSQTSVVGSETGETITLDAGDYSVEEDTYEGYATSYSADCTGTIAMGETKTCTVTNDDVYGDIEVIKYNDLNGNGEMDPGEEVMGGWEMNLTDQSSQVTGTPSGSTTFDNLLPGTYGLSETQQAGWQQTDISCSSDDNGGGTPTPTPTGTQEEKIALCHWNQGADKWNAISIPASNHGHDGHPEDYPYTGPYPINGQDQKLADQWCEDNDPRLQTTNIFASKVQAQEGTGNEATHTIELGAGDHVTCYVGNQSTTPVLLIEKTNNTGGADKTPGSDVVFTLTVTASESAVADVVVTDLPAGGFAYRGGTWTASSSVRGDIKALGTTTEPTYASPGTWQLGDMVADEVVTLTYVADISSDEQAGLYRDLAWANGTSAASEEVLANADTGVFVGTDVNVVRGTSDNLNASINVVRTENRTSTGSVLGASTSLPSTGAQAFWLWMGAAFIALGVTCISVSTRKRQRHA